MHRPRRNFRMADLEWLVSLLLFLGMQSTWANEEWLQLALPGNPISPKVRGHKDALSGWYAVSIKQGILTLEQATTAVPSDILHVTGKRANQLLAGKPLRRPATPNGVSLKTAEDTLVLMRIKKDSGGSRQLAPGTFPSSIAADILHEGWKAAGEVAGRKWNFSVTYKKRPDGKLLAGSLEVIGAPDDPNELRRVLVPRAGGMAFTKQELLWLGDMNNDGEPDLMLRRTWITGEVDFVLVVSPMLATAYVDPDRPATYFSSGVEPDSNEFKWHKYQPLPTQFNFIGKGTFSIWEEEWIRLHPDNHPPLQPKVLTDRQFNLNGETIRFTLEHLPRAEAEPISSSGEIVWGGSVVINVTFRGKSQVLMQTKQPDSGRFSLSVGLSNDKPAVRIDDQPHYNNEFTRYWIFDETEMRFRRLQTEQHQGC